jgi:hypothetical protein
VRSLVLALVVAWSSLSTAAPRKRPGDDKLLQLAKTWGPDFHRFVMIANLDPIWMTAWLCEHFDVDFERGELVFSDGGVPKIVAKAHLIGSYSTMKRRWRWGWAHPEIPSASTAALEPVRVYGEQHKIELLTRGFGPPAFGDGEWTGWMMMAVATKLVPSVAVYQVPKPDGKVYLLITSVKRPANNPGAYCEGRKKPLEFPMHGN